MLALALSVLVEITIATLFLVVGYQIFLSDIVKKKLAARKERRERAAYADKLFYLRVVSDSAKDIELFITQYAADLSEEKVKKLVGRVEYLRADKIVSDSIKECQDKLVRIAKQPEAEPIEVADALVHRKLKANRK